MNLDMQQISEALKGKGATLPTCPCCGKNGWSLDTEMAEVRTYHDGKLDLYERSRPVVPSYCSHCGYAIMFSAVILGLVPRA